MVTHRLRLILITIFVAVLVVCLSFLAAIGGQGSLDSKLGAGLLSMLAVLGPALLDSWKVEQRRLDPTVLAIPDDRGVTPIVETSRQDVPEPPEPPTR